MMRNKRIVVIVYLLVGAVLTSGCVMRGSGSGMAVAANAALAVSGGFVMAEASGTDCGPAPSEQTGWPLLDFFAAASHGSCESGKERMSTFGTAMVVIGAIGVLATLAANMPKDARKAEKSSSGVDFSAYTGRPAAASDPAGCAVTLAAFRNESDDDKKLRMLEDMHPVCRARLTVVDTR